MALDPELFKQLITTFETELSEQLQVITDNLLTLENLKDSSKELDMIRTILRAAHNIKGTSRSLGISNVGEIAHKLESLFSLIQDGKRTVSSSIIDLCFEAVDKIKLAFQSFLAKTSLNFDMNDLLLRLEKGSENKPNSSSPADLNIPKNNNNYESSESIRVDINRIEKISALMEEIQINKISMDDYLNELNSLSSQISQFYDVWKNLEEIIQSNAKLNTDYSKTYLNGNDKIIEIAKLINRINNQMKIQINGFSALINSFQEEVKLLRLIPADHLLCTLPRYTRDISHQLNKQVELSIQGENVKIDRIVLESLKDPVIHLLRNAIDHGIENADIRKSKGKPEVGKIDIEVVEKGNEILIKFSDDGAGIDIQEIAKIAEEKKLIQKDDLKSISEDEALELLFHPGFSTKDIITDISGRGIGLDVVRENIINLNGQVNISTTKDKGTHFVIQVPLTLASEHGMLFSVADQLFVIPTIEIERVLIIPATEIVNVEGTQAIVIEARTIPVRRLADVLELDVNLPPSESNITLLIVSNKCHSVAFIVDTIIGEREIVIKSLQPPLSNTNCIAGGTLLESNQVVIVLNTYDLLNIALHSSSTPHVTTQQQKISLPEKLHILVVDDSITTRTLEKNILESANYSVTVAVNGKEAWNLIQKHKFALVITDISMPIMDGFALTENIKKSDKYQYLPVIIVTSLGSDAEKRRGIEVGADAYIVKNEFESETLLNVVSQLV